jgi:CRP-like cAMP-binding protein
LPKPAVFKANSVVYFQGDVDERIYILKSGRIVLRSRDIETGQDINDLIQTGEFFGVKSASDISRGRKTRSSSQTLR